MALVASRPAHPPCPSGVPRWSTNAESTERGLQLWGTLPGTEGLRWGDLDLECALWPVVMDGDWRPPAGDCRPDVLILGDPSRLECPRRGPSGGGDEVPPYIETRGLNVAEWERPRLRGAPRGVPRGDAMELPMESRVPIEAVAVPPKSREREWPVLPRGLTGGNILEEKLNTVGLLSAMAMGVGAGGSWGASSFWDLCSSDRLWRSVE